MTDAGSGPDEATRRAVFAGLVSLRDRGYSVAASRSLVADLHNLTPAAVRAIEAEGVEEEWPPLGE
jgi:hypothetical protein